MPKRLSTILGTIIVVASAGVPGYAGTYTFNFNTLSSGQGVTQIANYMDGVLGCSGCVTVTGAIADQTYDGDGNVVGPSGDPLTLGTSNGATSNSSATPTAVLGTTNNKVGSTGTLDTFIANTSDSANQISNEIYITFSGISISSASFDYEIFPDGSSEQPPDLEFEAGDNTNGTDTPVASFGSSGTQYGVTPSSTGTDGSSTRSPDSNPETSAQYIGTWSGSLSNVSELDFIDWPATIGIDNLVITATTDAPVPEPGSVILLFTVAAGIGLAGRRRFRKA